MRGRAATEGHGLGGLLRRDGEQVFGEQQHAAFLCEGDDASKRFTGRGNLAAFPATDRMAANTEFGADVCARHPGLFQAFDGFHGYET